jgi:hypothetical protein
MFVESNSTVLLPSHKPSSDFSSIACIDRRRLSNNRNFRDVELESSPTWDDDRDRVSTRVSGWNEREASATISDDHSIASNVSILVVVASCASEDL